MTEREIPVVSGFLFGGKTDDASPFAPLDVSEPEFVMNSEPLNAVDQTPVFRSRREMRAAGAYDATPDLAAAPRATPIPLVEPIAVTPIEGIAALFPLLGGTASMPSVDSAPPTESTAAMPVAEIAAELATPIAPLVIHQEPIAPIAQPVPMPSAPVAEAAEQLDVASVFGFVDAAAPERDARRARRDAPTRAPKGRAPRQPRSKRTRPVAASTVRAASERKSIRQRATGLGVMVLVGGLFAVLALPAYADNDASSLQAASKIDSQTLTVSAAAASNATTAMGRDGYTATSAQDLKQLYSDALRKQNLAAYMQSGAKAQGDDYPWYAELSRNQGGGLSPLNYYYRECVDFVAWRLNRDAGSTKAPFKWVWSNLTPNGGNASQWKSAWLNHGWATGATPQVGAVAWFTYNHVGYVSGILNDGSVLIEEYNSQGDHNYDTRVIAPGDAYYLYAPPA